LAVSGFALLGFLWRVIKVYRANQHWYYFNTALPVFTGNQAPPNLCLLKSRSSCPCSVAAPCSHSATCGVSIPASCHQHLEPYLSCEEAHCVQCHTRRSHGPNSRLVVFT